MTREAILEAARAVYTRGGIAAVTLAAVGGAAEHFADDAALRRALVVLAVTDMVDATRERVVAAPDGEAALEAFIDSAVRARLGDLTATAIHLAMTQPGAGELVEPDEDYLNQIRAAAGGVLGETARRLSEDWGDELPQGIHPRRLVFLSHVTAIGLSTLTLAANAGGENMKHDPGRLVDEMCRALSAPTSIMRQLGALNDVAREMAGVREEETLVARMPELLRTTLEVDSAWMLRRSADGRVVVCGHAGAAGVSSEDAVAVADGWALPDVFARAMEERCTLFVADPVSEDAWPAPPPEDEHLALWRALFPGGACVVSPILCQGEIYGAIAGQVASDGRRLDRRDVSRFETFATMVGLALDNARWVSLIQSEKMASMSKLVAGVAHELNTPLGALMSIADVSDRALDRLSAAIDKGDQAKIARSLAILRDNHATSRRAGARIDERIQALRNFARLDESEHKRADLHAGIDSTLGVLAHELEGVTVEKRYGELPEVACSPNQLNQVFMNLLLNAARATRGEGKLTITTSSDEDLVVLSFGDDGKGIAPADIDRIFDPGFTQWDVGVGAGLGLSTCHQIVTQHRGRIEVQSELGVGSTFTLFIPR